MLSLSKRAERQVFIEAVLSSTLIVKPETSFFQFLKICISGTKTCPIKQ